ncbi:MAG: FecR domain-containing protein [Terriglobales bacterium]
MPTRTIVAALLAGAGILAFADSQVRIVRISFVGHGVEVQRPAEGGASAPERWSMALLNAPVVEAENVRTASGGQAEVELECGSALRLAPGSELSFPRLRLTDQGVRVTTVAVDRGTIFLHIRNADSRDFHAEVGPATIATPEGSANLRVDFPAAHPPRIELLGGHASVRAASRNYPLKQNAALQIGSNGAATWVAAVPAGRWQRWSASRDQAYQRELNAMGPHTNVDAASNVPPAQTPPQTANSAAPPNASPQDAAQLFGQMDAAHNISTDPFLANRARRQMVPYCTGN